MPLQNFSPSEPRPEYPWEIFHLSIVHLYNIQKSVHLSQIFFPSFHAKFAIREQMKKDISNRCGGFPLICTSLCKLFNSQIMSIVMFRAIGLIFYLFYVSFFFSFVIDFLEFLHSSSFVASFFMALSTKW